MHIMPLGFTFEEFSQKGRRQKHPKGGPKAPPLQKTLVLPALCGIAHLFIKKHFSSLNIDTDRAICKQIKSQKFLIENHF